MIFRYYNDRKTFYLIALENIRHVNIVKEYFFYYTIK